MVGSVLPRRGAGPGGDDQRGQRRYGRSLPSKTFAGKIRADLVEEEAGKGRRGVRREHGPSATADMIVPQAPLVPLEPNSAYKSRGTKYECSARDLLRHVGMERKERGGVETDEEQSFKAIIGRHHADRPPADLLQKRSLVAAVHYRHGAAMANPSSRPLRNAPLQPVRQSTDSILDSAACDAGESSGSETGASPGPSPMRPTRPSGGNGSIGQSVLSRNMRKFDHAEMRRRLNTEERKARKHVATAERAAAAGLGNKFALLLKVAHFATETRIRDTLECEYEEELRWMCEELPCELHLKMVRLIVNQRPPLSSIATSSTSPLRHRRSLGADRASITSVVGSEYSEEHGLSSDGFTTSSASQASVHEPVQHLSAVQLERIGEVGEKERRNPNLPRRLSAIATPPTFDFFRGEKEKEKYSIIDTETVYSASCASSLDLNAALAKQSSLALTATATPRPQGCHAFCIAHKGSCWKGEVSKRRFDIENEEFRTRMEFVQLFHKQMIFLECDASPTRLERACHGRSPSLSPSPAPRSSAHPKAVSFMINHEEVQLSSSSSSYARDDSEAHADAAPVAPQPVPVPRLPTPQSSFIEKGEVETMASTVPIGSAALALSRKISTTGEQHDRIVLLERFMREKIVADERRAILDMHAVLSRGL
eukprot:TRINITY_DN783_c0_g2_i1.p1 TRINITY_DN783_c0_g2~~TRINITY_DN783_c0_g2_i1.p1  ORF type:complete len:655 (+),score=175.17 TRINITY_DN783_c0_g2_i1:111-2075(+)